MPDFPDNMIKTIRYKTVVVRRDYRAGRVSYIDANAKVHDYFINWLNDKYLINKYDAEILWNEYGNRMNMFQIKFGASNSK